MGAKKSDERAVPEIHERLVGIREEIDDLDGRILDLLNRRARLSREVGLVKAGGRDAVFKPFREKEVLDNLSAKNPGDLPQEHLQAIYREILSSSRRLQRPQQVAYLGPEGTFSYFAAVSYLGHSAEFTPKAYLEDVFRAVASREAELGVIPLENSLQGTVGQSLDLFMRFTVHVQAEIYGRISHALLSKAEDLRQVAVVHSHPQPLAQCAVWLRANLPWARLEPAESTAAAAHLAAADPASAAIGHVRLAAMLDLRVAATGIEDLPDNWTRFLVIGASESLLGNRDKTSILFTLPDKPGALSGLLAVLAREGMNLTKLESRPLRGEKWKYVFFADVECDLGKDEYKRVLAELETGTHSLRVLGSYPAGPNLDVS
ncbi:MAG: prephenate dehydratase [Desulfovibrionaceae bacterium]|nr:prephenate dehydratase [Desulfovibrionaceae bacterium]MBF0514242.1 prephenate dehydratase [Desulfovibrionaceae bacterium]